LSQAENDGAGRVLRVIARKLEEYLDGDEMALETLAEALDQEGVTADDIQMAALGIRGLAGAPASAGGSIADWPSARPDDVPGLAGSDAHRVLSAEERDSLTTEAWGYLVDLRSRGTLDADQLERVIEALTTFGERPVEVARAREVAARVALEPADGTTPGDYPHGDQEVAH
jgi:uncharacterized protein Smg (DUF494 family)